MKFASTDDMKLFLLEVERLDLMEQVCESWKPSADLLELFITRRKGLIKNLKDFRKSQNTKDQWRTNRYKIMKGIKKFHKSSAGKQMHRSLGRFMSTRFGGTREPISSKGLIKQSQESESLMSIELFQEMSEVLKALASLRSRIYIQTEHYMPVTEYTDFLEFAEDVLESSFTLERGLLRFDDDFDEADLDIVARSIDEDVLLDEVCKVTGKDFKVTKKCFESLASEAQHSYIEILRNL